MRPAALVALVAFVITAGAACSGSSGSSAKRAATTTTTTTIASGGDATPTTASRSPLTDVPATTGAARPGPANSPTTTASPLEIHAELATACVRPGGTQTITIRTLPMSAVGFDAVYSDGKGGMSPGHYGGNKGGQTDGTGQWRDSWTVAANAPAGPVRVDVAGANANGSTGSTTANFAVANAAGTC